MVTSRVLLTKTACGRASLRGDFSQCARPMAHDVLQLSAEKVPERYNTPVTFKLNTTLRRVRMCECFSQALQNLKHSHDLHEKEWRLSLRVPQLRGSLGLWEPSPLRALAAAMGSPTIRGPWPKEASAPGPFALEEPYRQGVLDLEALALES